MSTGLICVNPYTKTYTIKNAGLLAHMCDEYLPNILAVRRGYAPSCVYCKHSINPKKEAKL